MFKEYADTAVEPRTSGAKASPFTKTPSPSLYEACKPEILGSPVVRTVAVFQYLRGVMDAIIEQKDIDAVGVRIGQLLDESLVVDKAEFVHEHKPEYRIAQSGKTWDLSKIDFEKLKEDFQRAHLQEHRDRRSARVHPDRSSIRC